MKRFAVLLVVLTLSGCGTSQISTEQSIESKKISDFVYSQQDVVSDDTVSEETVIIPEGETDAVAESYAEVAEEVQPMTEVQSVSEEVTSDEDIQPVTHCTLSVSCVDAIGKAGEKEDILPQDGVILSGATVEFAEGDSVFDVLVRELKKNSIHIEYEKSPIYGSAYIEGIANLYEFDCGELSGWIYLVNGKSPDVGCSDYLPEDGDHIEWIYITERNSYKGER